MTLFPRATSISAKLIRMNLLVSLTALVLACVAFFSYDLVSFQASLIRDLAAEARIVGSNSVSALLFNDKEAAVNTLTALSGSHDILGAAIVGNDGKVFAGYRSREGWAMRFPPLVAGRNQQYWISGRDVLLAQRIIFQGHSEGTVYHFCAAWRTGYESPSLHADCRSNSAALPGYGDDRHGFVPSAGFGADRCVGGDVPQGIEETAITPCELRRAVIETRSQC